MAIKLIPNCRWLYGFMTKVISHIHIHTETVKMRKADGSGQL